MLDNGLGLSWSHLEQSYEHLFVNEVDTLLVQKNVVEAPPESHAGSCRLELGSHKSAVHLSSPAEDGLLKMTPDEQSWW